nr:YslB family protein [Lysinibacillus timonensis]
MTIENKTIPAFGYEILRDYIVSSILGKHEEDVLYWAGKDLARKFPCSDMHLIISFFEDAGWGKLTLVKEAKDGYILKLTNDPDLLNIEKRTFRLEAGFIAEQIQSFNGYLTECYDEKNIKQHEITFTVKSDLKEKLR